MSMKALGRGGTSRPSWAVWPGCWHSMWKPRFAVYDTCRATPMLWRHRWHVGALQDGGVQVQSMSEQGQELAGMRHRQEVGYREDASPASQRGQLRASLQLGGQAQGLETSQLLV